MGEDGIKVRADRPQRRAGLMWASTVQFHARVRLVPGLGHQLIAGKDLAGLAQENDQERLNS